MSMMQARKAAFEWATQAETKFDMDCTYAEGESADEVTFRRSGVSGTLTVTADTFELQAKLGFLLGAFKDKIEGEIVKNLDALIAHSGTGASVAKAPAAAKAARKPGTKRA
jgi:putative polyhydroxyalkanoate system protein